MGHKQLQTNWDKLQGISIFNLGQVIVTFAQNHVDDGSRSWNYSNVQRNMLDKLFESRPDMTHVLNELEHSPNTVSYIDGTTLVWDTELTFVHLVARFSEPSSKNFDRQHRPITGIQVGSATMKVARGLKACGPLVLTYNLFSSFPISPLSYFSEEKLVFVNSAGAFPPPHLDYEFILGFSTIVNGKRLFVTFGVMEGNSKIVGGRRGRLGSTLQGTRGIKRDRCCSLS